MKVLLLGLNYSPEKVGIAVYSSGMAEALAANGHDVRVVAGRPYYPAWHVLDGHNPTAYRYDVENGVKITRVPHYIPRIPSGAKRLIHHASFAITAFFPMLWISQKWRPDVVIAVAPSLIAAPLGSIFATLCRAVSWLHIQDFEVEAAFATKLISSNSISGRIALWFDRFILTKFDKVSTISPQMVRRLKTKGLDATSVYEFRNWSEIGKISPSSAPSTYRTEWGIETKFVALYSGNIGNKQGIEIIIEAAQLLRHRNDLTFVICGEGQNLNALKSMAAGLDNVKFFGLQPKDRLGDLLSLATIHLLPQIEGAADLVLPSKLTNMLASGRPIVATTRPDTGLGQELVGCGALTPPGDEHAFAAAIDSLLNDFEKRVSMGDLARDRAVSHWSGKQILEKFEQELLAAVRQKKIETK